jgi:Tol biopolymer transport system component
MTLRTLLAALAALAAAPPAGAQGGPAPRPSLAEPAISPDRAEIAFVSTRTGNGDVYVLDLASGEVRRVTHDDGFDQLDGWSRDGRWLYFSSTSRDVAGMNDLFRVSADGRTLFYVSDRGGAQNLWAHPLGGEARQLTRFRDGRVLWPSVSADGRAIVFERGFRIWRLDPESGAAAEVPVTLRGAPLGPGTERRTFSGDFQELALSPDGKKVALVVRGEVFAASAKEGGDAERVTSTPGRESQVVWAPDSRRLVYVSDRDGVSRLYLYDFATRSETQLTRGGAGDASPRFSPDGIWIAFARGGRELRLLDPATGAERVLATGYLDLDEENHGREGVVVDLRNNNGGFVNAYALDVFARRPYMTMTVRGLPAAPARTLLGQRALEAPTVLVVNQHSLSDAEDFTEGYRALGLGKVVGEPTAGWIIYTWNLPLVDGSVIRIPRTLITGSKGDNMELAPRPVDVAVTRPLGEGQAGRDSQLDAAVRELLGKQP